MDKKSLEQLELEILNSGKWGTIAPHSISAASALAARCGAKHGLLCHSADAALEALLRHLGARFASLPHGDALVVGEIGSPAHSLIGLCVGAKPLFTPTCERCGMIAPATLEAVLSDTALPIRAVVIDYLAEREQAAEYPLEKIGEICRAHHVPLILDAGGCIGARHHGEPLTTYADAVLYSLGEGSAVDAGGGGFVSTDCDALWAGTFAYHNCGRGFGAGCSLVMDNILGGDMRVTEWIAAAAEEILRLDALALPCERKLVRMKGQPVFDSAYAKKSMGELTLTE